MSESVRKFLITLKEAGLLLAVASVLWWSGRTYQVVSDMREQIKKAVPQEQYDKDKAGAEEQIKEVKEAVGSLDKKLDNRMDCITVRLDSLYNLILRNGEQVAEGK